jgi:hypothetical protein
MAQFDLTQLAEDLESASSEDMERIRREGLRFTYYHQLTDDDAIALLRQILTLRTAWLQSRHEDVELERQAQRLIVKFAEGVAGWAYSPMGIMGFVNRWRGFVETHPEEHRQLLIEWLAKPLPFMPQSGPDLLRALDELRDSKIHPLLRPRKGGRRGEDPRRRTHIQLTLLAWIEWQVAAKLKTRTRALDEVARLCGITPQAIKNWKARLGVDSTSAQLLEAAVVVGELRTTGKGLPEDDPQLRQLAEALKALDVRRLASDLRRAAAKRTIVRATTSNPLKRQKT